jgi:hypothetical protein
VAPRGALVEPFGELFGREDPIALGHELADLLPVGVVVEQHPEARTAGSRGEVRVVARAHAGVVAEWEAMGRFG